MGKLNVVYACDDNYAPYACVSMCSLLENNKQFEEINIYVVLSKVTQENQEKLKKQAERYGANFIPVDAAEIIREIKELKIPEYRGSYATNFRLFFHKYMAEDAEKFFYLDCDTIICNDLRDIYDRDMGENCAYVVQDALTNKYKQLLGFRPEEPYFNAGVMLVNARNWKKRKCTERMLEHLRTERSAYCNPDQDLLNIVLKDSVEFVGPEYNFQPIHRMLTYSQYIKLYENPSYYTEKQIQEAKEKPMILHTYRFLGEFPWHAENRHPDTEIFDRYMAMSEQKDYCKKPANVKWIMKIEKLLYVLLPRVSFFRLFKLAQDMDFAKRNEQLKANG